MTRAAWISIIFAIVMGVGALMVHREFRAAESRPAVQRQLSEQRLRQFSAALSDYRTRHGTWPETLYQLMKEAHMPFGANVVKGMGVYVYRPPGPHANDATVVMASDGQHAAIGVGDPWGAEGQVATVALPAVTYLLTVGGQVEAVSPHERDQRWTQRHEVPSEHEVSSELATPLPTP